MIEFACDDCGRIYSVADEFAGRRSTCRVCNAPLVVPQTQPGQARKIVVSLAETLQPPVAFNKPLAPAGGQRPTPVQPVAAQPVNVKPKLPMRLRRLMADAESMARVFRDFPPIRISSMKGNPPEHYQLEYHVGGLARGNWGSPVFRDIHVVEIQLTSEYPRQSPKCNILTPIFHPNFNSTIICVGDHWTAGERLVDLVIRIGEMIAYQAYNIMSPLDGEAAMWADLNRNSLPIDKRSLRPPECE